MAVTTKSFCDNVTGSVISLPTYFINNAVMEGAEVVSAAHTTLLLKGIGMSERKKQDSTVNIPIPKPHSTPCNKLCFRLFIKYSPLNFIEHYFYVTKFAICVTSLIISTCLVFKLIFPWDILRKISLITMISYRPFINNTS